MLGRLKVCKYLAKVAANMVLGVKLDPKADLLGQVADSALRTMRDLTKGCPFTKALALVQVPHMPQAIWKYDSMQRWLVEMLSDMHISEYESRSQEIDALNGIINSTFAKVAQVRAQTHGVARHQPPRHQRFADWFPMLSQPPRNRRDLVRPQRGPDSVESHA